MPRIKCSHPFFVWLKTRTVSLLIKILNKIDKPLIESCTISDVCEIKIKSLVPPDGKWHHMAMTVEFWARPGRKVKHEEVYMDGVLIRKVCL